ncbi:Rieske (2Fe-2S) protein [Paracraurococcus lichenis]|uniref:Rieske 2Fe-2S domain-containing protein n=1 Tax=Paracraurococcus lichenis TaxID=3064888 RepID=A0ABT9DYD7_9PROT|nr:Rieske 2Fe-2S domain-containing protein [Paracraurococcus sp. LOR1-02]MDO9708913.1 Rieske 2Fe-2S domain-containing protein [Paracraurococcus sp. LOR1-02]
MDELFVICATHEVEDGGARGFVLARPGEAGGTVPWPILVSRKGRNFYGFENACPHQGLRLDQASGEFMDDAGNFLTCSHHGAQFDLDTGHCFAGPCQGKALTPIRLVVDDGDVCVSGVDLADEDGLDLPESDVPEVVITSD